MYTQANKQTLKLKENDRFIVSHNHAFKIEQIDNYINEYGVKVPTYIKVYLTYEPILPEDNLELNIANYDNYKYIVNFPIVNEFSLPGGRIFFCVFPGHGNSSFPQAGTKRKILPGVYFFHRS
jgi:hypothetical protein